MNFLAHLVLAGDDEALRLGAMLGDFVRGRVALQRYPADVRKGIRLHRRIDSHTDTLSEIEQLRSWFPGEFRRYAGIVIDLALDHELAREWSDWCTLPLDRFDREVREMLERQAEWVPDGLDRFMAYADRRGLFEAYREEGEVLHSLRGVGRRLSRPNPLGRVDEIWPALQPLVAANFSVIFRQAQSDVEAWLKSRSTITGS
jgi:acyl carrier protein phosphodiesterase